MGRLGILFVLAFAHIVAGAQTLEVPGVPEPTTIPANPPPIKTQKIVVTGSYIRRDVDDDSPSPVTTIKNTNAQEAGTFSAGGLLNDSAITSSNGNNVSFHGQPAANNLVLLNGLRLPKPGGDETSGIDFLPASSIERVEVLKDGASALYGSEALTGVVNIITKKEYDGLNISVRGTTPESPRIGQEVNFVTTYGKNFSRGNFLGVLQYRHNEPQMYRDTEYGIVDPRTGTAGSLVSNPGNLNSVSDSRNYYRATDCPANQVNSQGRCTYDYYNALPIENERDHINLLLSSGWDLGDKLRLETAFLYTHQFTKILNTPYQVRMEDLSHGGGNDYTITGAQGLAKGWGATTTPASGAPALASGQKYTLLYSADEELGIKRSKGNLDAVMTQVKIGKEKPNYEWDFSIGYGLSDYKEEVYGGNADKVKMHNKLIRPSGDPDSWDPFKPAGAKDSLADAMINTWTTNFADIWNARYILSGKLLEAGPKSIYAAFGVEGQLQSYRYRVDAFQLNNTALSGQGSNQNGDRNVTSTFLELTQNPLPRLQLQAAARFDEYSDFGSTVNPKLGANFKVNDVLSLRASYGTGFKAPDLRSLYQGDVTSSQRLRDNVVCSLPGGSTNPNCNNTFPTTSYGNRNLKPELGDHYNFGMQFHANKKWRISVDHWRLSGHQALQSVDLGRLTSIDPALLPGLGVDIQREPTSQAIQSIRYPLRTNSGTYRTYGIDFELKYQNKINPFKLGVFNYTFRFDHSQVLGGGRQPFSFQPYERNLDMQWKNVTSFSVSRNAHLMNWRIRTFSMNDKDTTRASNSTGKGSVPTYSEHDLHYEYYGAWQGVITVGVRNIFDTKMYNELNRGGQGFLLPASATYLGRTLYAGYSQDF